MLIDGSLERELCLNKKTTPKKLENSTSPSYKSFFVSFGGDQDQQCNASQSGGLGVTHTIIDSDSFLNLKFGEVGEGRISVPAFVSVTLPTAAAARAKEREKTKTIADLNLNLTKLN